MKFIKNNLCTVLMLTLIFSVALIGNAEASVFNTAMNKLGDTFKSSKLVLFIIGGFGLMALAFQAIFGKLKWAWFAALAFGLAVISAAGGVVQYASNTESGGGVQADATFNDSLK